MPEIVLDLTQGNIITVPCDCAECMGDTEFWDRLTAGSEEAED